MSFEALEAHAAKTGKRAAIAARDRILAETNPPAGVKLEAISDGILLTGPALRRQVIDDPHLRNFTR